MNEQSKAFTRRKLDPRFTNRWFVGRGLDIGCGPDPISKDDWPNVTEVVPYDVTLGNIDGRYLPELADSTFDFVHASHCLEHLSNARSAFINWLRVLKPGGWIICTVPDEWLYELGQWPSRFNNDHKLSFTTLATPVISGSINLVQFLWKMRVNVELLSLLSDGWDPTKLGQDQTLGLAECAIEMVVRKPVR